MRGLAFLVFLLFCGFLFWARHFYVCQVKQLCEEELPVSERLKSLELKDDGVILLEGYDQFAFDSGQTQPDLNANNESFMDTLSVLLKADSTKNLTITAFYRESETDLQPGFFENMGIARADEIRKLLINRGIDESRISLDHGISEDETLSAPLLFDFYTPSDVPEEYDKVQFTFTNMTFSDANFAFDSDEFKPGEPFHLYADSVKTYFVQNPDKMMTIIGHTDNIGDKKYNYELGLRRAKSTLEYFRELGVTAKIDTDSKGEKRAVASNKTSEGRQKNRRVNFVIE
jgi:outer membrane protein OmpA-like peptidoglycan-associated protein